MKLVYVILQLIIVSCLSIIFVVSCCGVEPTEGEVIAKIEPTQEIVINDIDYLSIMKDACLTGDTEKGLLAENLRNNKIDLIGSGYVKISYNDLYLLSKIITWEAGSYWLSDEHQMLVGNVILNRVASPEFPNTLYDCVYQTGQYSGVYSKDFENLLPSSRSVNHASSLLAGKRICPEDVVFQANFKQGGGVYKVIEDKILGKTYFCYSSNRHLYN